MKFSFYEQTLMSFLLRVKRKIHETLLSGVSVSFPALGRECIQKQLYLSIKKKKIHEFVA